MDENISFWNEINSHQVDTNGAVSCFKISFEVCPAIDFSYGRQ